MVASWALGSCSGADPYPDTFGTTTGAVRVGYFAGRRMHSRSVCGKVLSRLRAFNSYLPNRISSIFGAIHNALLPVLVRIGHSDHTSTVSDKTPSSSESRVKKTYSGQVVGGLKSPPALIQVSYSKVTSIVDRLVLRCLRFLVPAAQKIGP